MKTVFTVHDLHSLHVPEDGFRQDLTNCRESCRKADVVIAISSHTKQDLVERLDVPEAKVVVVPLAPSVGFGARVSSEDARAVRERHGIERPFFYTIGMWPRKNVATTLKAFAEFVARNGRSHELVLAGYLPDEPCMARYRALIDEQGIRRDVKIVGPIPDQDVEALMKGAAGFLFPSLCEGFGIPVLEAMAVGCPVICSNTTSLPEVAGDAAIQVAPEHWKGIADAMERLEEDRTFRDRLVVRGRARAEQFTWKQTAAKTLAVYRTLQ